MAFSATTDIFSDEVVSAKDLNRHKSTYDNTYILSFSGKMYIYLKKVFPYILKSLNTDSIIYLNL